MLRTDDRSLRTEMVVHSTEHICTRKSTWLTASGRWWSRLETAALTHVRNEGGLTYLDNTVLFNCLQDRYECSTLCWDLQCLQHLCRCYQPELNHHLLLIFHYIHKRLLRMRMNRGSTCFILRKRHLFESMKYTTEFTPGDPSHLLPRHIDMGDRYETFPRLCGCIYVRLSILSGRPWNRCERSSMQPTARWILTRYGRKRVD
jgi:hypothetical protein